MAHNIKKSTDYDNEKLSENIEKNFILIMKPRELIDADENNSISDIKTKAAVNILDQIFEELRDRNILENETIKDIRFIIYEYLESLSFNDVNNSSLLYNIDQYDESDNYWDSPYESPNHVA